jgi:hypothetical protein
MDDTTYGQLLIVLVVGAIGLGIVVLVVRAVLSLPQLARDAGSYFRNLDGVTVGVGVGLAVVVGLIAGAIGGNGAAVWAFGIVLVGYILLSFLQYG